MYNVARRALLAITVCAFTAFAALGTASATNLVANGSFETGDFTSWSVLYPIFGGVLPATNGTYDGVPINLAPEDGTYFAALSPSGTDTLSQTLSTTAGATYDITYYLAGGESGYGQGEFGSSFGSTTMQTFGLVPISAVDSSTGYADWTEYSYTETATSSSTLLTLSFTGSGYDGYLGLDNVSVTPAATPEAPTTIGLGLMAGLGMLLMVVRAGKARRSQI